jgi:hypothetical protein
MISSWEAFNASVNVIYYFKLEIMEKKKKIKWVLPRGGEGFLETGKDSDRNLPYRGDYFLFSLVFLVWLGFFLLGSV